jgi:AraC-like DNA-binding protein
MLVADMKRMLRGGRPPGLNGGARYRDGTVLSSTTLLETGGLHVHDVQCQCGRGGPSDPETSSGFAVVLVRRGAFRRTADGEEVLLDPTLAYVTVPGAEQRFAHPIDGGDACTAINLSEQLRAELLGGDPAIEPAASIVLDRDLDLRHRLLLAALRRGDDATEDAIALAAELLARLAPGRVWGGLPAAERRRRALADDAREALAEDAGRSVVELGRAVGASPHHLSRVFTAHTGRSITEHRRLLRVRAALERLADGDSDLARLAADVGFADHAHLTRTLRAHTGATPSALRAVLS